MSEIKTRDVTRGTIKTLDKGASAMHRMKEETIRSKAAEVRSRSESEPTDAYAQETVEHYAGDIVPFAARAGKALMLRVRTGSKRRDDQLRQVSGENVGRNVHNRYGRRPSRLSTGSAGDGARKAAKHESSIYRRRKEYAIRRIREKSTGGFLGRTDPAHTGRNVGRTAKGTRWILRRLAVSTKTLITTMTAGSTVAMLILVVVILCGGAFAALGDEDGNDFAYDFYGIGYGDTAIVKVAQAQLGNVGGNKFWKWYGFKSRVDWCAIFVSWCGNECGYIKKGIIPKFAVVGDGARWFRDKGQWAGRGYSPKAGDIIFFDYEGDGLLNHVGIVESCDGKYVTTIEGNSGDTCKRNRYIKGSKQIAGYGVPMYGLLMDPGNSTLIQAGMVAWAKKIAADDTYGYKNWVPSRANTHKCPVCHPGSGNGWNCIGFAFAVWHHGGGLKSKCNCGVIDDATWQRLLNAKSDAQASRIATEKIGVPVIVIRNNGKTIPQEKIRAGDICGCFSGGTYYHTTFSIGKGEIIHCTGASSRAKEISKRSAIACKVVIRYAGIAGNGLSQLSGGGNRAQSIAAKATELAYPDSPKAAKYPGGAPTAAYAAALNRAYPNRSGWSKPPRDGASCDVFVGVCLVDSGVDKGFPRGYSDQANRLDKRTDLYECIASTTSGNIPQSILQDGDIIRYVRSDGGVHIFIYAGGKIKQAAYDNYYPRTNSVGNKLSIKGKKLIKVYRAKG